MTDPNEPFSLLNERLDRLGICYLCRYRLLHGSSFHCYGFPKQLHEDVKVIRGETSSCSLCFGLLCGLLASSDVDTHVLADHAIAQIVTEVKASQLDFSSFQLNVSEPAIFALRDHGFWAYMRENGSVGECPRSVDTLEEDSVPAKVVFRNLVHDRLMRIFRKPRRGNCAHERTVFGHVELKLFAGTSLK
uniref:tRNA pseudouridine(54/55) synthase Pus10 n=1 Tax=Mesocestoides corti TaxID=53468 RepID=A0A5K3G144_MESCO